MFIPGCCIRIKINCHWQRGQEGHFSVCVAVRVQIVKAAQSKCTCRGCSEKKPERCPGTPGQVSENPASIAAKDLNRQLLHISVWLSPRLCPAIQDSLWTLTSWLVKFQTAATLGCSESQECCCGSANGNAACSSNCLQHWTCILRPCFWPAF